MLDADIEACFDSIDHAALMDRVRLRVKDKRVLALVKAFLKAGILTELGEHKDTHTGTPQGGILSPLLANIALSVLDEHLHGPWQPGGAMSTASCARRRRVKGPAELADRPLRGRFRRARARHPATTSKPCAKTIASVLAPLGLRLSAAKTQVVHMSDGFDFLGFHIQWSRKTRNEQVARLHLHRRPADPVAEGEDPCPDAQDVAAEPQGRADPAQPDHARLGQLLPARRLPSTPSARLAHFVWWRVVRWLRTLHRWRWKDVRRRFTTPDGRWKPITADGIELFNLDDGAGHPVPLPGQHDPQPLDPAQPRLTAATVESPVR